MSATPCPHCGYLHDTTGCPTYPKGISGPVLMTLPPTVYCHNPEPVGSPAYVRRLRDQTVSDRLARFGSGPMVKEDVRGAVRYANYMVEALGYQIPEEGMDYAIPMDGPLTTAAVRAVNQWTKTKKETTP